MRTVSVEQSTGPWFRMATALEGLAQESGTGQPNSDF